MALGLVRQYQLTHAADPTTLVVRVDGEEIPADPDNGWTYDRQHWVLYFHGSAIPERGAEISVTYEIVSYAERPEGAPETE